MLQKYGRQYILNGTNEKSNKQNKVAYQIIILYLRAQWGTPSFCLEEKASTSRQAF